MEQRVIKFRAWNPKYKTWCGKEKGDWWLGLEYNSGQKNGRPPRRARGEVKTI